MLVDKSLKLLIVCLGPRLVCKRVAEHGNGQCVTLTLYTGVDSLSTTQRLVVPLAFLPQGSRQIRKGVVSRDSRRKTLP